MEGGALCYIWSNKVGLMVEIAVIIWCDDEACTLVGLASYGFYHATAEVPPSPDSRRWDQLINDWLAWRSLAALNVSPQSVRRHAGLLLIMQDQTTIKTRNQHTYIESA